MIFTEVNISNKYKLQAFCSLREQWSFLVKLNNTNAAFCWCERMRLVVLTCVGPLISASVSYTPALSNISSIVFFSCTTSNRLAGFLKHFKQNVNYSCTPIQQFCFCHFLTNWIYLFIMVRDVDENKINALSCPWFDILNWNKKLSAKEFWFLMLSFDSWVFLYFNIKLVQNCASLSNYWLQSLSQL